MSIAFNPSTPDFDWPTLRFKWLTYQDPRGDSLAAFGRVWDRYPRFAPDVIDHRDPPRAKYETVEAGMTELSTVVKPGPIVHQTTLYSFGPKGGRRRPIVLSCTVQPCCEHHRTEAGQGPNRDRTDLYPQWPTDLGGSIKAPILSEENAWPEFFELFKEVAVEVEAYFGYVTPIDLTNQFVGSGIPSVELGDVEWINFYGPSLLEHWGGPERLAGVGVEQEPTLNGGMVLWATESPPSLDPRAKAPDDYEWKQPFYEALGRDTFYRPQDRNKNQSCAEEHALVGVHLPTIADQRRHARQFAETP